MQGGGDGGGGSDIIVGGGNGGNGNGNGGSGSTALSRIGIGENAPKPPHLLAVPIQRRPLFPGFMAPLGERRRATGRASLAACWPYR